MWTSSRCGVGASSARTRIFSGDASASIVRAMMASLNKLTDANFARIAPCIASMLLSDSQNSVNVADMILGKCYQEHSFIPLYSKLIAMLAREGVVERNALNAFVDATIEHLRAGVYDLPSVNEYDSFCNATRNVHFAVGRNATVIQLIFLGMVSIERCEYLGSIVDVFRSSLPQRRAEIAVELITQFATFFLSKQGGGGLRQEETELLSGVIDTPYDSLPSKIRFKLMHLRDLCDTTHDQRPPAAAPTAAAPTAAAPTAAAPTAAVVYGEGCSTITLRFERLQIGGVDLEASTVGSAVGCCLSHGST
jgi:hypothetical protein